MPMTSADALEITQPIDMTFDVGGVEFNGLDILQGFIGAGVGSLWNGFDVEPSYTTPSIPVVPVAMSQRNTLPSSPGRFSGPSTDTLTYQTVPLGVNGSGSGADFWSQVAGGSF